MNLVVHGDQCHIAILLFTEESLAFYILYDELVEICRIQVINLSMQDQQLQVKQARRKIRNRKSAQESRRRKKEHLQDLEVTSTKVNQEVKELKKEVNFLKTKGKVDEGRDQLEEKVDFVLSEMDKFKSIIFQLVPGALEKANEL